MSGSWPFDPISPPTDIPDPDGLPNDPQPVEREHHDNDNRLVRGLRSSGSHAVQAVRPAGAVRRG